MYGQLKQEVREILSTVCKITGIQLEYSRKVDR